MYRYDELDATIVQERADEFRDQVRRRLSGELTEDQFKPLRLTNGLYLQLHAYMLRVAIPYGTLNSHQMRGLADISRRFDKGYGHFTTRQNIQFNWIKLRDAPDVLDALAAIGMHGIQTSGNCIRNITTDPYAGAAADEYLDPRPWCEYLRQWSTFHPEFSFLPRKFKIAVTASKQDRAAVRVHDIGLELRRNEAGALGFRVFVGGGLGRTPYVGPEINSFVPADDIVSYLEACMRTYNRFGRRDNLYKSRIKILVATLGPEEFGRQVAEEWAQIDHAKLRVSAAEIARISAEFTPPKFADLPAISDAFETRKATDSAFAKWTKTSLKAHKQPGYTVVVISLKPKGVAPGDASADQMDAIADLTIRYGHDDVRVTHEQNLVLPHVKLDDVPAVYDKLVEIGLATANVGLISDIVCCPGLDYCSLANARSIPVATAIQDKLRHLEETADVGELRIKISGCINACGHHHVGHIGILGVEKKGEEFYQILLGGSADENAALGEIQGRGLAAAEVPPAIFRMVERYLNLRQSASETFAAAVHRLGTTPFKEVIYAAG